MQPRLLLFGCLALLHAPAPGARADVIIDDWQTAQQLATPPAAVGQVAGGPGVLGGFRGSSLLAGPGDVTSLVVANGVLTFAVDPAASGNAFLTVTWDGPPPGTGLGGVDVTGGGAATGFSLGVIAADGDVVRYSLSVADTVPLIGTVFGVLPDGTRGQALAVPFSLFIAASEPVRIDMTRVDKIQLQFEVSPGGRVVLGPLQAPAAVPGPAGAGVWAVVGVAAFARARRRAPR
jgi:hypothetical protein